MSLDQLVTNVVYDTLAADDAVYVDSSGDEIPVRVVPEYDPATLLGAADVGVRGVRLAFTVRKSEVPARPRKGDHLVHQGTRHCLAADGDHYSSDEWMIYVSP